MFCLYLFVYFHIINFYKAKSFLFVLPFTHIFSQHIFKICLYLLLKKYVYSVLNIRAQL